MKLLLFILLMGLTLTFLPTAFANPFGKTYVCVPKVAADPDTLEFRIRDGGPCEEEEEWKKVITEEDGVTILFPSEGPLNPEIKRDLEHYKTFYGIIR